MVRHFVLNRVGKSGIFFSLRKIRVYGMASGTILPILASGYPPPPRLYSLQCLTLLQTKFRDFINCPLLVKGVHLRRRPVLKGDRFIAVETSPRI